MKHFSGFHSETIDTIRASGGIMTLAQGSIRLPREFGFCRGVTRALTMLEDACTVYGDLGVQLYLLGEIIHNPWVNDHFARQGVRILTKDEIHKVEDFISPSDCAILPAFGVTVDIQNRISRIGCKIIDTSCGDVRRLWLWARRAANDGFGVLIYGKAMHDETVVTKSILEDAGGKYVVVSSLAQVETFVDILNGKEPADSFSRIFPPDTTNAASIEPFAKLAQVSQTTMLYDDTMLLREVLLQRLTAQIAEKDIPKRLMLEPTVCRATQDRQSAALELCKSGCDLTVVIGGFGSSNTRHLYEIARAYGPAIFIESVDAIVSSDEIKTIDTDTDQPMAARQWLPAKRPLHITVLSGASSPEIVVGEVVEKLAEMLK